MNTVPESYRAAIRARRYNERNVGDFNVRKVNKNGSLSKVLTTDRAGYTNLSLEKANKLVMHLENLNPGKSWKVVEA